MMHSNIIIISLLMKYSLYYFRPKKRKKHKAALPRLYNLNILFEPSNEKVAEAPHAHILCSLLPCFSEKGCLFLLLT